MNKKGLFEITQLVLIMGLTILIAVMVFTFGSLFIGSLLNENAGEVVSNQLSGLYNNFKKGT